MSTPPYTVAILGLGRIGASYDDDGGTTIRSHVGAVLASADHRLVAAIDPDHHARDALLSHHSDVRADQVLESIEDLAPDSADIIAICTPLSTRADAIRSALAKNPKIIVSEKPLAANAKQAQELTTLCRQQGCLLAVNFHRRFDPRHRVLRDAVGAAPHKVVFRYSKGMLNYASHFVDLMVSWFGPPQSVRHVQAGAEADDPNPSFTLHYDSGLTVHAIGVDGIDYDLFDAEFWLADKRLDLRNGGCDMSVSEAKDNLHYPGYRQLGPARDLIPSAPVGGMVELYQALADHLSGRATFAGCTGDEAVLGLLILDSVLASAGQDDRPVEISTDPFET